MIGYCWGPGIEAKAEAAFFITAENAVEAVLKHCPKWTIFLILKYCLEIEKKFLGFLNIWRSVNYPEMPLNLEKPCHTLKLFDYLEIPWNTLGYPEIPWNKSWFFKYFVWKRKDRVLYFVDKDAKLFICSYLLSFNTFSQSTLNMELWTLKLFRHSKQKLPLILKTFPEEIGCQFKAKSRQITWLTPQIQTLFKVL
jgi:hypothetical protein